MATLQEQIDALRGDKVKDPFIDSPDFVKGLFRVVARFDCQIYALLGRPTGDMQAARYYTLPMVVTYKVPYDILAPSGWQIAGMMTRENGDRYALAFVEVKDKRIVHWVRSYPEKKPAKVRGFYCGAPFDDLAATSYYEQVTCEACTGAKKLVDDRSKKLLVLTLKGKVKE